MTIGCDRLTKRAVERGMVMGERHSYLGDTVRLEYVENGGAFLGIGGDLSPRTRFLLFTLAAGLGLIAVAAMVLPGSSDTAHVLSWSLILAGGMSNLIDRALRDGMVVDFMNLGLGRLRTGIFNVADVAITAGAALVLLAEIRGRRRRALTPPGGAS